MIIHCGMELRLQVIRSAYHKLNTKMLLNRYFPFAHRQMCMKWKSIKSRKYLHFN